MLFRYKHTHTHTHTRTHRYILQIYWHFLKFPNSLPGLRKAAALFPLLGVTIPQSSVSVSWDLKPQTWVLLLNRHFIVCMPVWYEILYWLLWQIGAFMISSASNPGKMHKTCMPQIWVYCYNKEMKQYSSHLNSTSSPHPKKVRQVWPNIKNMSVILLNCEALLIRNLVLQIKRTRFWSLALLTSQILSAVIALFLRMTSQLQV